MAALPFVAVFVKAACSRDQRLQVTPSTNSSRGSYVREARSMNSGIHQGQCGIAVFRTYSALSSSIFRREFRWSTTPKTTGRGDRHWPGRTSQHSTRDQRNFQRVTRFGLLRAIWHLYIGPYEILKCVDKVVIPPSLNVHPGFHLSSLVPGKPRPTAMTPLPGWEPINKDKKGSPEYEVEHISAAQTAANITTAFCMGSCKVSLTAVCKN